ncbi:MAG: GvpL/GvpF family gas vesicle protein [Candidatus Saganbacteria bacterium]|nr:GvpL/GvpF family gas vesicle protein [Candidatus Saganbacteria bacterium]
MSKCVYGIVKSDLALGSQNGVYIISYQDIAAVVSDFPAIAIDSLSKEELLNLLASHQAVVEKIMKNGSIVPLKFGTILAGEEDLQAIIEQGYPQFQEILKEMEGKIELDIVAMWNDLGSVLKEVAEEEEIRKLRDELNKKPPAERLQGAGELGKMVKDSLDKKKKAIAAEIKEVLKSFTYETCEHALLDDSMIMNTAFLIEKRRKEDFENGLDVLNTLYEDKINFRCVGPLPPYSFSTLEVEKISFAEIDSARRLLGLSEEVSKFQIKDVYREMASNFHPDKHPGNGKQFKKITQAYKLLLNYCGNGGGAPAPAVVFSLRKEDLEGKIAIKVVKLEVAQ